jgi:3-mercaptopyruvate sulfurtransferase SseA
MSIREKYSAILLGLGLILALLPLSGKKSLTERPSAVLKESFNEDSYLTVDQVARSIVNDDSTIRLIDLRSPEEFNAFSIPGSINAPYKEFLKDPSSFLGKVPVRNILYSNGDFVSGCAFVAAAGMNFRNVFVMKGGLNEWGNTVMNSIFTGERITTRENALFETRKRAKQLFTEFNSLPDSLKLKLAESKRLEKKKLDGGCE